MGTCDGSLLWVVDYGGAEYLERQNETYHSGAQGTFADRDHGKCVRCDAMRCDSPKQVAIAASPVARMCSGGIVNEEESNNRRQHCHVWATWPYSPRVPYPRTRGSVERLLGELNENGVDRALIVCAAISFEVSNANADNNDYVRRARAPRADHFDYVVDVDSNWSIQHHHPGARERLDEQPARTMSAVGITHNLTEANDGWLQTGVALEFFAAFAECRLLASMSPPPSHWTDLAARAAGLPSVQFLLHHLGWVKVGSVETSTRLSSRLAASNQPNICIKISGVHCASARFGYFPVPDTAEILGQLVATLGARRLPMGSDFPASVGTVTYSQPLGVPRTLLPAFTAADRALLMGGNLARIIDETRPFDLRAMSS